MNSLELTSAITALANAIACKLSVDEIALWASLFVQLGDTLATIAARENLCGEQNNSPALHNTLIFTFGKICVLFKGNPPILKRNGGGNMEIFKVILTALLSVAALFIITKIMGHKQVAQLDFFDYVSGITIGSIGAELATELEAPEKPLIALAIYGLASMALNLIAHKIPRTRKYINGTPTILMNGDKLYRKNLKQAKLDLSEFLLLCREQGYFDLDEIQTAVFEHNGKLSILPKAANRPATPEDLKITAKATHIGVELIMDGCVLGENLSRIGREEKWLRERLQAQGYKDEKAIFLAIYRPEEDRLTLYSTQ